MQCFSDKVLIERFAKHLLESPINVTGYSSKEEVIAKLIEPSLFLEKIIKKRNSEILDGGTGGGIPGIILAIKMKKSKFVLIDSRKKKIDYLNEFIADNSIDNCLGIHGRVEKLKGMFDAGTARGLASPEKTLDLFKKRINKNGRLYIQTSPSMEYPDHRAGFILKDTINGEVVNNLIYEKE